jgi:Zn-dependent protease/CBS domain-containing protein
VGTAVSIGRWFGVPVRVHPGWILVTILIVISLSPWLSSPDAAGLSTAAGVIVALAVSALLFVSALGHELAHAVTARRLGVDVPEIRLTVFGGTTFTTPDPSTPRIEGLIALAGPLFSIVLGLVIVGLSLLLPADSQGVVHAFRWVGVLAGLGNLLLAALSLAPAYPMDGGVLTRAILWGVTRDQVKATRWTSLVGRLLAYGLMFGGFLLAIGGTTSQVVAGLWLVIIGWFLSRSARGSYNRARLEQLVDGMSIADALDRNPAVVGPNLTLDTLIQQHERDGSVGLYPVTQDGDLLGAVELGKVARIPRRSWPTTRVGDVMRRVESLVTFTEPQPLMAAVASFEQTGADAFPVVAADDPTHLLGLVTRENTLRLMRSRAARLEAAPR